MLLDTATTAWRSDGFAILPGYLTAADLAPALAELPLCFPTPEGFHTGSDPRRSRFVRDEFDGIDTFPFASTELSLLAVHARVVELVAALLDGDVHRRRRLRAAAAPRLPRLHDPRRDRGVDVRPGGALRLPASSPSSASRRPATRTGRPRRSPPSPCATRPWT